MERIRNLISLIQPQYSTDDPGHDWPHIGRVVANVNLLIRDKEVDLPCLLAAAYGHDLVNLPKNHPERSSASALAGEKMAPFLQQTGFSALEIQKIKQIILEHSFSKGMKPTSVEAAILQDADRLDALGAIGVLRCASVNTQMKTRFYDPFDPIAENRPLDDKRFMLDHYFVKLFKLPELMNTEEGKVEAAKRVKFMQAFLDRLLVEIRN